MEPRATWGMEIDLVAHCGNTTEGQYLNTLARTDITALAQRSQKSLSTAIQHMRQRLPFPLLGIDSDNGSEFINDTLYRYRLDEKSRLPDRAHTRKTIRRMSRKRIGRWLNISLAMAAGKHSRNLRFLKVFMNLQLYINFFQPPFKLIAKERIGKRTIKRYDTAKTP